ncbi:hypothetical protein OG373_08450 [Streptomyces avidinii]|uniref:hypothetical protein n=1 Tax=Streptomyces avidinii TaxID=1895 RepID=UPI00386D1132|nr:hypothetical protein OG373_08450 [Streptomyces avidinii]
MTLSRTARWTTGWLSAAAWALSFLLFSSLGPHRLWGWCAAAGYLGAAAATALGRPRAALGAALLGAVAVPLLWLVLAGQGQSEVAVIERSGRLLLESGRPYVDRPAHVGEYTPYLPGMALLGVPRALLGGDGSGGGWAERLLGDARIWCAAALFGCLWAARRLLAGGPGGGPGREPGREPGGGPGRGLLPVLVASPVVALPLVVSGVDLPLAGLCCLALAAAASGRPAATGAALAGACALKWTALPAVAVAVALLAACRGGRSAVRCALVAAGGTALLVLPGSAAPAGGAVASGVRLPHRAGGGADPGEQPAARPSAGRTGLLGLVPDDRSAPGGGSRGGAVPGRPAAAHGGGRRRPPRPRPHAGLPAGSGGPLRLPGAAAPAGGLGPLGDGPGRLPRHCGLFPDRAPAPVVGRVAENAERGVGWAFHPTAPAHWIVALSFRPWIS